MTIKKLLLLLLIVPLVFTIQSCGKGAGSGYNPPGSGPGDPSYIKLKPARYVTQTNGCIDFYAEVHDAEGKLLSNVPVTFTNLSEPFGQLLDRCGGTEIAPPVIITTDTWGRAKVSLYTTTPGFATILAQTYTGSQPRDRKTVLFSACNTYDCLVLAPSLRLDVDSVPGNGIYNETSDFIIFEPPPDPDNTVELLATVRNAYGVLLRDAAITWGADHAEAAFTRTEPYTNVNGQAVGIVQVTPLSLRDTDTHVTVWATATNVGDSGAYDVVTLFLRPVVVNAITVMADPSVVAPGENSTITATATLSTGDPLPDGITVLFSTCDAATCTDPCGFVDPFAQTVSGSATVTFTAPDLPETCRVNARINSATGSVNINVTEEMQIIPASQTLADPAVADTAEYTILGGTPAYSAYSSNPGVVSVAVADSTLTATVDTVPVDDTTVTITVYDSLGNSATAQLVLQISGAAVGEMQIIPASQTLADPAVADTAEYTILGGTPAYSAYSSNPGVVSVAVADSTLTATVDTVPVDDTTVTITVYDSLGNSATAQLVLQISGAGELTVTPSSVSLTGIAGQTDGDPTDDITFYISGGTPDYSMFSNNNAVIASQGALGAGITTFTIDPDEVSSSTSVTLTVVDSVGATKTVTVTVTPATSAFGINPSAISVTSGVTINYHIIGGLPPYDVYTSDTAVVTVGGGAKIDDLAATTFDAQTPGPGSATITIVDSDGQTVPASVTVN